MTSRGGTCSRDSTTGSGKGQAASQGSMVIQATPELVSTNQETTCHQVSVSQEGEGQEEVPVGGDKGALQQCVL